MLLGVASAVVKVVAKPLLLLQKKPPPEAYKSPGPPKLAINSYLLGVICLVRPPSFACFRRLQGWLFGLQGRFSRRIQTWGKKHANSQDLVFKTFLKPFNGFDCFCNSPGQMSFFLRFLVIARSHELGFGLNLVEIYPRSLPDLFKQLRDPDNSQKHKKLK